MYVKTKCTGLRFMKQMMSFSEMKLDKMLLVGFDFVFSLIQHLRIHYFMINDITVLFVVTVLICLLLN